MSDSVRMLVINNDGYTEELRNALRGANPPIRCIVPADRPATAEEIRLHLSRVAHGSGLEYDMLVIDLRDAVLAEAIARAAIDKIPWQPVIIIGEGPLSDPSYRVSFTQNMLGVAAEMKRLQLIK